MAKSKLVKVNEKIAENVVSGYKKIENGVVGGAKAVEKAFADGYRKIEDEFVDQFLTKMVKRSVKQKETKAYIKKVPAVQIAGIFYILYTNILIMCKHFHIM